MTTVRDRLEALPVTELAEIREKLRQNAAEREALEAAAYRLLEQWTEATVPAAAPASLPVQVPAPAIAIAVPPASDLSLSEAAVLTINSNPDKHFSAMELAQIWNIRGRGIDGFRSALSRLLSRGRVRKVAFGRYASIHAGRPT